MAATPTTPINPSPARPLASVATTLRIRAETLEIFLTLLVLAALTPLFLHLRGLADDGRFAPNYLWQVRLPPKSLPDICRSFGDRAPPKTANVFCGDRARGAETPGERLPVVLEKALDDLRATFADPLQDPLRALKGARQLLQEGLAAKGETLPDRLEAIQSAEAKLKPYLDTYKIAEDAAEQGPLPVQCLYGLTAQTWRATRDPDTRAALALWLAAAPPISRWTAPGTTAPGWTRPPAGPAPTTPRCNKQPKRQPALSKKRRTKLIKSTKRRPCGICSETPGGTGRCGRCSPGC